MQNDKCPACKWFYGNGECKAFPYGIPMEILQGAVFHDKVVPGQEADFVYTESTDDDSIDDLIEKS